MNRLYGVFIDVAGQDTVDRRIPADARIKTGRMLRERREDVARAEVIEPIIEYSGVVIIVLRECEHRAADLADPAAAIPPLFEAWSPPDPEKRCVEGDRVRLEPSERARRSPVRVDGERSSRGRPADGADMRGGSRAEVPTVRIPVEDKKKRARPT
jgi:hypothetical protein